MKVFITFHAIFLAELVIDSTLVNKSNMAEGVYIWLQQKAVPFRHTTKETIQNKDPSRVIFRFYYRYRHGCP